MSLLSGRNLAPLSQEEVVRAINTFLGLDKNVNVRYEPGARTLFRVAYDEAGTEFGEIVIGPDIYPGTSVVDPNSAVSLDAAAAHELSHYHRWKGKLDLSPTDLRHLDEALTSLQAISRYDKHLTEADIRQLAADAIQRLHLYIKELPGA